MPHEIDDLCAFFIEENEYTPSAFRMLDNIRNDEILWWRKRIGSMTPGTKSGPRAQFLCCAVQIFNHGMKILKKEFPQHSAIFPLLVHQRSPSAKNRP
jgi:hypothetical protein